MENIKKHLENIDKFYVPSIVAINRFSSDTEKEINWLINWCKEHGYEVELCEAFAKGGEGAISLANKLVDLCSKDNSKFSCLYEAEDGLENKIEKICKEVYGAEKVEYSQEALKNIDDLRKLGLDKDLLVCMAKTPMSFSDNENLIGRPSGFTINVKEVRISNGVKFAVVLTGNVLTMPGLPRVPAANKINIDKNGKIEGLF